MLDRFVLSLQIDGEVGIQRILLQIFHISNFLASKKKIERLASRYLLLLSLSHPFYIQAKVIIARTLPQFPYILT